MRRKCWYGEEGQGDDATARQQTRCVFSHTMDIPDWIGGDTIRCEITEVVIGIVPTILDMLQN